jgi:threonylcarbamoyladenosine tRNA methylthiotransferase MtaB
VDEAAGLVSAGVREIVLTGINIGRYSHGDVGLAELIEAVAATGISRLRLSSIEPLDITPALIEVIRATRSFCPHLHVPLQSGSDPVLAGMGRGYTVAEYRERVSAAREAIPGLAVTTDVIAGFPGETAEQAAETLRLCEAMAFSKLHVFRYSKRAGTPAATREDQVPAEESSVRASALRDLGARAAAAFAHGRLGETVEVLVERVDTVASGTAVAEGITPDHLRVRFAADGVRVGQLASVRLERVDGACVHGLSAVREPTA